MTTAPRLQPADAHNRTLLSHVHPDDWVNPTPRKRYDLVVVGGGVVLAYLGKIDIPDIIVFMLYSRFVQQPLRWQMSTSSPRTSTGVSSKRSGSLSTSASGVACCRVSSEPKRSLAASGASASA